MVMYWGKKNMTYSQNDTVHGLKGIPIRSMQKVIFQWITKQKQEQCRNEAECAPGGFSFTTSGSE